MSLALASALRAESGVPASVPQTVLEILGENFLINGVLTYSTDKESDSDIHGLLFNVRAANAIFDDRDGSLPEGWLDDPGDRADNNYAGFGAWDPAQNTSRFINQLPLWRRKGVLAVSVNFQGGCSCSRNGEDGAVTAGDYQTPDNNPFGANGDVIDPDYLDRMARIIDTLNDNGMIAIIGIFYFGQDQRISAENDSEAVKKAVDHVVDWILANDWRNVIIEINNEANHGYQHDILQPVRVAELMLRVKQRGQRPDGSRIFVSSSLGGGLIPSSPEWLSEADVFLLHGNGQSPADIWQMIQNLRSDPLWLADPRPIVFNEDGVSLENLDAAAVSHASWGFYDDRHHQSVYPAQWELWHPTDIAFFNHLAGVVYLDPVIPQSGDVNGDRQRDGHDAITVAQYLAGSASLLPYGYYVGDMNDDQRVAAADLAALIQAIQ
jgi:hypothetical protein